MKKKLIVIVGIIILNSSLFILHSQAQLKFGVRAGANLVNMKMGDGVQNLSGNNRSGFYVGPTIKFGLPIVGLGIDASALYDQRSGEIKATGDKLKMQSIQIPINVRYAFGLGDLASIYLFLGPQFGFNVGSKEKKFDFADWSLKTANVSGNVGLGLMLLNHLQFSANYNFAFTKMGTVDYGLGTTDVKGNAWQLALAYYF